MNKFLANFVSILLIPLFAPTYLFCIILFYFPHLTFTMPLDERFKLIAYIFSATTLIPFVFVFILFKLKKISSLSLNDKRDRPIPQLFSFFNYLFVTIFMIDKIGINDALTLAMISVTTSLIIITITTHYWKISAHSSGVSGILAIVSVLFFKYQSENFLIPYIILLILTVSVCLARLYLKVHTLLQVLIGCVLGGTIGTLIFYFSNITISK